MIRPRANVAVPLFEERFSDGTTLNRRRGRPLPYEIQVLATTIPKGIIRPLSRPAEEVWNALNTEYRGHLYDKIGTSVNGRASQLIDDVFNRDMSMFFVHGVFYVDNGRIRCDMSIHIATYDAQDDDGNSYTFTEVFCFFDPVITPTGYERLFFTQYGAEVITDWIATAIENAGLRPYDVLFEPADFEPRNPSYYEARMTNRWLTRIPPPA